MTACAVQYGLRTAEGVVSHARDKAQAEAWLAYDHRHHQNVGEVLVRRLPGHPWRTEEEEAAAIADAGFVKAA